MWWRAAEDWMQARHSIMSTWYSLPITNSKQTIKLFNIYSPKHVRFMVTTRSERITKLNNGKRSTKTRPKKLVCSRQNFCAFWSFWLHGIWPSERFGALFEMKIVYWTFDKVNLKLIQAMNTSSMWSYCRRS